MFRLNLKKHLDLDKLYFILDDMTELWKYINKEKDFFWGEINENILFLEYKNKKIKIINDKDIDYKFIDINKNNLIKYNLNLLELELIFALISKWELEMFKVWSKKIEMPLNIKKWLLIWYECWKYFENVLQGWCFYNKEPLIILENILCNKIIKNKNSKNEDDEFIEVDETKEEINNRNIHIDIFSIWIDLNWELNEKEKKLQNKIKKIINY